MSAEKDPREWIDDAVRHRPQQLFLQTPAGEGFSYEALRSLSGRFAAALVGLGVVTGDRVAVQVDKSPQAVLLYVACLRLGAVFVPINPANKPNEVEYFLRDAAPRVAVIRPEDRELLEPVVMRTGVSHLETLGESNEGSLPALVRQADEWRETRDTPAAHALAAIVYTSGTTGRSKGAMLTRRNLGSNAAALVDSWRFTSRDILLHTLPLFHVHGLFAAINTVLASGSGLVLMPRFDAASTLMHLPTSTVYMGVPTHYSRLLLHPELNREKTAGTRLFISGSAPLLAETHREFYQRTGHKILERFGMTETLMNTSNPYEGSRLAGSVGLPLPGVAVRVADRETGAPAKGADTVGILEVTGPNVFAGYWGDPQKTLAEFTPDGWFKTGDLGRIDADGYVHIVGRAKDLVISGGYNVYPREVELELDGLPGVLESAVFGVPHPDFGEGVTAAVVLKPGASVTETGIILAVQSRLARYKVPKRILLIDELPRNAMGKVQKAALRTLYAALYAIPA